MLQSNSLIFGILSHAYKNIRIHKGKYVKSKMIATLLKHGKKLRVSKMNVNEMENS